MAGFAPAMEEGERESGDMTADGFVLGPELLPDAAGMECVLGMLSPAHLLSDDGFTSEGELGDAGRGNAFRSGVLLS
jgi:hypothetical protein